jgi:hypothetical protein
VYSIIILNEIYSLVGHYLTPVPKSVQRTIDYLGPTLEDRLEKDRELGFDWPERPVRMYLFRSHNIG